MEENQGSNKEKGKKYIVKYDCILLIDDDEITNFINRDILSNLEIAESIESTSNIDDAFVFLKNCGAPNKKTKSILIILDLIMPVRDGFDFLDELNSQMGLVKYNIDIVVLTNSLDVINKERVEEYNILDYILKPLTLKKIQNALYNSNITQVRS